MAVFLQSSYLSSGNAQSGSKPARDNFRNQTKAKRVNGSFGRGEVLADLLQKQGTMAIGLVFRQTTWESDQKDKYQKVHPPLRKVSHAPKNCVSHHSHTII